MFSFQLNRNLCLSFDAEIFGRMQPITRVVPYRTLLCGVDGEKTYVNRQVFTFVR